MRVLVTGIGGFAGPVAAAALRAAGHEVHGLLRGGDAPPRLATLGLPASALHRGDLLDGDTLPRVLHAVQPDGVLHLAGRTFVPAAAQDVEGTYRANLGGTLAVLAAVREHAPRARVVAVGSGDAYGAVRTEELPIDEDTPFRPVSVYGASKAAADLAAGQWARSEGLAVICARPFNHTGPGQEPIYVCSSLARQAVAAEQGRQPPVLAVGNLDPVRDFSDVRDIAAGYVALLEHGRSGAAYNLCSGEGVSIAEVIAVIRTIMRIPVRVRVEPTRVRRHDVPRVVGSYQRATEDTGWRPRIALADTLAALVDDWRARGA